MLICFILPRMKLDPALVRELNEALLDAFLGWDELQRMVRYVLGEELEAITAQKDMRAVVFTLVRWAEAKGKLDALLDGACNEAPGNAKLQEFARVAGRPSSRRRYVSRPAEEKEAMRNLALLPGAPARPVVLKGPNRLGKSTLLRRLGEMARERGASVFVVDLEQAGKTSKASFDAWMRSFAKLLIHELRGPDVLLDALYADVSPWTAKLTDVLERDLLPRTHGNVVLSLENADAVWGITGIQEELFGMLRVWCEKSSAPWDRFRLALAVSTIPSLHKDGPQESPWNLAPPIYLTDFTLHQTRALASHVGPVLSDGEAERLLSRVGGHPFLLEAILGRAEGMSIDAAIDEAERGDGPLGGHLRSLCKDLRRDTALAEACCAILASPSSALDDDVLDRLLRAGIVAVPARRTYRIRFPLYETYLREHLCPRSG